MDANSIALSIGQQLGPQCLGLIGATNLSSGVVLDNGFPYLKFKVAHNSKNVTHVVIYYNPIDDLYDVDFFSQPEKVEDLHNNSFKPVSSHKGAHASQLYDILEKHADLQTTVYKKNIF
jgi:hypothetical protein